MSLRNIWCLWYRFKIESLLVIGLWGMLIFLSSTYSMPLMINAQLATAVTFARDIQVEHMIVVHATTGEWPLSMPAGYKIPEGISNVILTAEGNIEIELNHADPLLNQKRLIYIRNTSLSDSGYQLTSWQCGTSLSGYSLAERERQVDQRYSKIICGYSK